MIFKLGSVLTLVTLAASLNLESELFSLGHKPEAAIAKLVTRGIQWRMQNGIEKFSEKRPIISPIKDPLLIPELINTPININIPEIISIIGNLFIGETEISGLSGLVDDFQLSVPIVVIPMSVNWNLELPKATMKGPFTIDGNIESPQTEEGVKIEGTGDATGSVESVFFRLNAIGRAPAYGFMELSHLDVDLGFKNLSFAFDGLTVGGEPNDFSYIAPLIQTMFDFIWTDETRPVVNEMIRCSLNHTVSVCNVQQLIQGYLGCLQLPDPKCFGEDVEEPGLSSTTVDSENPTTEPVTNEPGLSSTTIDPENPTTEPVTNEPGLSSTTIEEETKQTEENIPTTEPGASEPTTPTGGGTRLFHGLWSVNSFLTSYLLYNALTYI